METEKRRAIFAFPARVIKPFENKLNEQGVAFQEKTIKVEPYELPAFLFQGMDGKELALELGMFLGENHFSFSTEARWGNRKVIYFCGQTGRVVIEPKSQKEKDKEKVETGVYSIIRSALEKFSRFIGGMDIIFHAEDRHSGVPSLPDQENTLHIFPWNHPPGDGEEEYIAKAFDLLVDKDAKSILTFSGVPGRGELVGDGKHDLIQMIGHNWYLLFCVIEYFNDHTTEKILERALAAAFKRSCALQKGARPNSLPRPLSRRSFISISTKWIDKTKTQTEELIREQEEKVEEARRLLAERQRSLFNFLRIREEIGTGERSKKILESSPEQWKKIRSNPRIAKIEMAGDGIHATTIPVVTEDSGCLYNLGPFVIRIHKNGDLFIWNLDRLHPEGVPHPHINKAGTPCLGNASSAVQEAVVEYRFADAFDYLVQWLFDGYEEKLALHKISEWPIAGIVKKENYKKNEL